MEAVNIEATVFWVAVDESVEEDKVLWVCRLLDPYDTVEHASILDEITLRSGTLLDETTQRVRVESHLEIAVEDRSRRALTVEYETHDSIHAGWFRGVCLTSACPVAVYSPELWKWFVWRVSLLFFTWSWPITFVFVWLLFPLFPLPFPVFANLGMWRLNRWKRLIGLMVMQMTQCQRAILAVVAMPKDKDKSEGQERCSGKEDESTRVLWRKMEGGLAR